VQEFSRILEDVKTGTEKKVILDFSRCSYISSDGLNTTAQFWKWCKKEKTVAIAIVAVDDKHNEIRNLFDIIGLSAMVGEALAPTVEKAVEFLQKPQ
jgi:anti-anti-sigma regulatory factor